MQTAKKAIKKVLSVVPPFDRWLARIEAMRHENGALRLELETAQRESKAAQAELKAISRALWVPPGHFSSPIPDLQDLELNEDEIFEVPPAIRGVDLNETGQLELLKAFARLYPEQPFTAAKTSDRRYFFDNPNYSYGDAIVLYCVIRFFRPQKIMEVGSGYSSCAILDVNELFFDNGIACTFIDPFPHLLRSLIKKTDQPRVQIISEKIQDIDPDLFRELRASDILFIDSSHVAKTGSDVNYILFKILPLLAEGVLIHFHDIFYPFEYPKGWVIEGRAWNETYLMRAFLQYNNAFSIRFFATFMTHTQAEIFESQLPLCMKNSGASLWLEKTRQDEDLNRVLARKVRKPKSVPRRVDLTYPGHNWLLGEGWHAPETNHRWMESEATVQIAGPEQSNQSLHIRGGSPHVSGVQLTVHADGGILGLLTLKTAGPFDAVFPLAGNLIGQPVLQIRISVDRIHDAPGDSRKLGISIIEIAVS